MRSTRETRDATRTEARTPGGSDAATTEPTLLPEATTPGALER